MSLRRLILLSALAFPAALSAQQRRGTPMRIPQNREMGIELKASDLEKLSPAKIVDENRKELALDQSQINRLDAIRKAFDSDAKHFAKVVRRLQKDMRSKPPQPGRHSDDKPVTKKDSVERARKDSSDQAKWDKYAEQIAAARRGLGETMLKIRASYDSTAAKTVAILTDDQRAKVGPLLEQASNELTMRLRRANIR